MTETATLVQFSLDAQRYALEVGAVVRVVPAAAITSLSDAPPVVMGVINLHGEVVPVLNARERFRLPQRQIQTSDYFIIARAGARTVALLVDHVEGVAQHVRSNVIEPDTVVPGIRHVRGVVKLEDGLLLIQDLERFLSLEEESMLDRSMETKL